MINRFIKEITLAFFAFILFFPSFSTAADETEMPRVNVIEIEGIKRISGDVVREKITQEPGELLSPDAVSNDIKSIFGLGYFDDVNIEMEPFEGGIKLVYAVKEKPFIRRTGYWGNKKVEDDKIKEAITISPGSVADAALIQRNAEKIRTLYEEKGYPLSGIVPIVVELEGGSALLTYQIEEGPKVKVRKIAIEGNEKLSDRKIKRAMRTREWWIFSWLTSSGRYEKETLNSDVRNIKNFYYDYGYLQASVSEPEIFFSEDRRRLDISLKVSEGQRFDVASIDFSGNTVFSDKELRDKLESKPGDHVSKKALDHDVVMITDMLADKGYALANVYPEILPTAKENVVKLTFKIYEGDIYRVGRISISGNQKTRDKVIRREIRLNEGDIFSGSLIRRSYQKINNLKFFETVSLKPTPNPDTKTLDIDVNVSERSTGFLNLGAGYSSVDRFVGMVEITQGNWGGLGRYAKVKAEFGSKSTLYELSYKDPWLFDKPVEFSASLYNSKRDYESFDKNATGFELGLGRRFKDYWSANVFYQYEEATILNVAENATDLLKEQEGTSLTSSISPSIERDSRDNVLDPHTGSRNAVRLTYAGLGGDNEFFKAGLDSMWVIPVTENSSFSARGRFGFVEGFSGKDVPLYERYTAGGGTTIKGLRNVGPTDDSGNYIGGTKRVMFNFEYVFPLVLDAGLKGEIFYDIGSAYDDEIEMRDSAGAGIRWLSPIGPLAIDWARIISPKAGEPDSRWEFTIGTFF